MNFIGNSSANCTTTELANADYIQNITVFDDAQTIRMVNFQSASGK